MTDYTRLTIIGSHRKAQMVVPGDEPIGSLIPRLMHLLDEKVGAVSRPLCLVRSTGEQLDTTLSIGQQRIFDGEILRLVREDAAPPPPEVADVTDVLADTYAERADLWGTSAKRAVSALAIAGGVALLGTAASEYPLIASGAWLALVLCAAITGRVGARWIAVCSTAAAVGLSVPLGVAVAGAGIAEGSLVIVEQVFSASLLVWAALAIGVGAGLSRRSVWWGGVIGAALSALPLGLAAAGLTALQSVGVTAVVATVICGLLPWYAMSASGLTGLDDQVVEGRLMRRDSVLVTVYGAYSTLTWSTVAVAVPLGLSAGVLLAAPTSGSAPDGWAIGLGAATVLVTASRTRAMPLKTQGWALWAAVISALTIGATMQSLLQPWAVAAIIVALVIAAVIAGGVSPAPHQRASLRRVGNFVEPVAVVAMLPLLVGMFGVYAELLGAF